MEETRPTQQRRAMREQLEAAWQLQMARIEQVIEERFEETGARVREAFSQELEARLSEMRSSLRSEIGAVEMPRAAAPQAAHLRASRFARVQVAEMRLYKANAVREGRARKDLYTALREDIDDAREAFRLNFVAGRDSMADYLHLELVRTLANDDPLLLGPGYPGPLV
jgi:hypothetical protein